MRLAEPHLGVCPGPVCEEHNQTLMAERMSDFLDELHRWAGALRVLRPEYDPTATRQTRVA